MKTEQEHLRSLIDALGAAHSAASFRFQSALQTELRRATAEATALAFYRNQRGWNQMALLLDEAAKRPIRRQDWPATVVMLANLRDKVRTLANRATH